MRSHLVSCFCIGKLSHFPSKPRKVLKDAKHEETLSVFCLCRMPEDKKGIAVCSLSGVVPLEMPEDSSCCVYEKDSLAL